MVRLRYTITPKQIAAPSVKIEEKTDGLLIHVSAKAGDKCKTLLSAKGLPNSLPEVHEFTYYHDFHCTFSYEYHTYTLKQHDTLKYAPVMRWCRPKTVRDAIQRINSFLYEKAGGRPHPCYALDVDV